MGAVELLGLVRFWEGVSMLIKPGFESPTCRSNVNFGVAIFGCNFGFIYCVFCEAFISNGTIGLLSTVAWVRVSWGFVENSVIMAVN